MTKLKCAKLALWVHMYLFVIYCCSSILISTGLKIINKKKIIAVKNTLLLPTPFLKLDLDPFPPEERYEVKVREGVGAVLLCEPPYHYPGNSA